MSDDDYKRGYREGFMDGFKVAQENVRSPVQNSPNVYPNPPWNITCGGGVVPVIPLKSTSVKTSGCSVCGIKFEGTYGYGCPRLDCPSKVVVL